MKKRAYFDTYDDNGWPELTWLWRYFIAPPSKRWFYDDGNDSAVLHAEGVNGTEHLEGGRGRIDIHLEMWGNPELGVLLIYSKWGGGHKETFSSKGDMSQIRQWVRSLHDTLLPIGLFIPFEEAWKAVKEFFDRRAIADQY